MSNLKSKLSMAIAALALVTFSGSEAQAQLLCFGGKKCKERKMKKNEAKARATCNPDLQEFQQNGKCRRSMSRIHRRGGDAKGLKASIKQEALKTDQFRQKRELAEAKHQAKVQNLSEGPAPVVQPAPAHNGGPNNGVNNAWGGSYYANPYSTAGGAGHSR